MTTTFIQLETVPQFRVSSYLDGILVIQENCGKDFATITTCAKEVVAELASKYELPTMTDRPYQAILYEDSFGVFDLLLVRDKQFVSFLHLGAKLEKEAIQLFKQRHLTPNPS